MAAILDAKANPISRPVDAVKLARPPRALKATIGDIHMPGKKQPGKLVVGDGKQAFSSSSTPSGGKVPKVDVGAGANSGGIKPNRTDRAPTGRRVPDWRT